MKYFHLKFVNDTDDIHGGRVLTEIKDNTHFSFSYVALLVASCVICTLGLLLNSLPIIIGGMIIAPLMWPLLKISAGISYENKYYISQAFLLLIISVIIGFASSYFITLLSPIKMINEEIISRTTPTVLDIIIAVFAGVIAALAVAKPRISSNLAGVAVATSLMPPLCVSGIGLALTNISVFYGGSLLFISNILSIIFISALFFYFAGMKNRKVNGVREKSLIVVVLFLIITAIPLFIFFKNYTLKTNAYQESQEILQDSMKRITSGAEVDNVSTNWIKKDESRVLQISADVWLPNDISLNYQQQQEILENLRNNLGENIDLKLKLQRKLSITSKEDLELGLIKAKISTIAKDWLKNRPITIQTINVEKSGDRLEVNLFLVGSIDSVISQQEKNYFEYDASQKMEMPVDLSIDYIPRIELKSQIEENLTQ